jgi:hypothetical protein
MPYSGTRDGHLLEKYQRTLVRPFMTLGFVTLSKMDISLKHGTDKYGDMLSKMYSL